MKTIVSSLNLNEVTRRDRAKNRTEGQNLEKHYIVGKGERKAAIHDEMYPFFKEF